MYSVNGIPLHNAAAGLTLLDSSEWAAGVTMSRPSLTVPGLPGSVPMDAVEDTPALAVTVGGDLSVLQRLRAVLGNRILPFTRAGTPGEAAAQLSAISFKAVGGGQDPYTEATIVFTFPGVYFRTPAETVSTLLVPADPGPGIKTAALLGFEGVTGHINDALIRFHDCTNPRALQPSSARYVAYTGTVGPASWLRIDTASGRAWLTGTDTWTGGTEVDPLSITSGAGPGFLTLSPITYADLSTQAGVYVTATAVGPGASADLRARSAHVI